VRAGSFKRQVTSDFIDGRSRMHVRLDYGDELIEPSGMVVGRLNDEVYEIDRDDPLSARIETGWTMTMARGAWSVRTTSEAVMSATADAYHLTARLDVFENGALARTRTWEATIPREGVSTPDANACVAIPEERNS
jgi:hypothetical protein